MRNNTALNYTVYILVYTVVITSGVFALIDGELSEALSCLTPAGLFLIPTLFKRIFKLEIPASLELFIVLFIYASAFLGEIGGYYDRYKLWDSILHITSGFIGAAVGFSIADMMCRGDSVKFLLTAGFVSVFAVCFSVTVGVVWEVYEFLMDMMIGTDMQKDVLVREISSELLHVSHVKVRSAALNGSRIGGWLDIGLIDTMKDLIVCTLGALIFSAFGYIYVSTHKQKWVTALMLTRKE